MKMNMNYSQIKIKKLKLETENTMLIAAAAAAKILSTTVEETNVAYDLSQHYVAQANMHDMQHAQRRRNTVKRQGRVKAFD